MEARLTEATVGRCDVLEQRVAVTEEKTEARLISLEMDQAQIESWRPAVEKRLDNISLELSRANKFMERESFVNDFAKPGILPNAKTMGERLPPRCPNVDGPDGHHFDNSNRDRGFGRVFTQPHGPVKGTLYDSHPAPFNDDLDPWRGNEWDGGHEGGRSGQGNLPRVNFPQFNGDNPQLWKTCSENYFDMYDVDPSKWIRVAYMHFEGRAACWLQSVERRVRYWSWQEFCAHIHDRFGREQHESLIRHLFQIRQTTSVADYVERFSTLVDHLSAYEANADPLYYTMRFVDGLREEIKAVIMVQRPSTLDTACALALVQEEALEVGRGVHGVTLSRQHSKMGVSSSGPPKWDQPAQLKTTGSTDEKLASLRRFRRARGLCEKCAGKWSPGHKCAATAQLQAMEEVWELLPTEEEAEQETDSVEPVSDTVLMSISQAAWLGSDNVYTLQLHGLIQGHPILILIDSGSSRTFVNSQLRSKLHSTQVVPISLHVRLANGDMLHCQDKWVQVQWQVQGCTFFSDISFLPLTCYDMVVGMDWLQQFSPMKVDWNQKWLSIPYQGSSVVLYGQSSVIPDCTVVEICLVSDNSSSAANNSVPPQIQSLLNQYAVLFEDPTGLPPSRDCDHAIPLVLGAQPFTVRPYRYPPLLKDEIETQVADMLKQGVIQKSHSPFASPVLLVKKKDNTWRFCVDYRYLNALTVKSKYPVPVFDQLMDELAQSQWFSKLDLKAGYHQILLKQGEEYKTAFQTHMGHYEFRVMAFGLTGAPNTFLAAMNATLQPVLRKCALVFFDDILVYNKSFQDHLSHLSTVLQLLLRDNWKVKLSKCDFAKQSISYLGHVVSAQGVATDPAKIQDIEQWRTPSNTKELRSFLGLAGFYRKFVRHFGIISRPLFNLLKKHTLFVWTQEHQKAFDLLKTALVTAPVLALPDFSKQFYIYTDACQYGIGAVLMQQGHPLAFLSRALGPKNQGLSTYEKEYLAIILAVVHWRAYLQVSEFVIYTDHSSLVQLNEQRLHTPWQQRLYSKLAGLQYRIVYKKGVENAAADALSRQPQVSATCASLSHCTPTWLH